MKFEEWYSKLTGWTEEDGWSDTMHLIEDAFYFQPEEPEPEPKENPEIDISIDTSEDFETITMTFVTNGETISIGFSIAEIQMLSMWLNEAVGAVLSHKIGLTPLPETKH